MKEGTGEKCYRRELKESAGDALLGPGPALNFLALGVMIRVFVLRLRKGILEGNPEKNTEH